MALTCNSGTFPDELYYDPGLIIVTWRLCMYIYTQMYVSIHVCMCVCIREAHAFPGMLSIFIRPRLTHATVVVAAAVGAAAAASSYHSYSSHR